MNRLKNWVLPVSLSVVFLVLSSCATSNVARVSADSQIDLSGRWNDTDSQMVATAMINDVVSRPWISDFTVTAKRKPVLIVGEVKNRSDEHIDAIVFTKSLERELINAGKVKFVASSDERSAIREEKNAQQNEASAATMKKLGQETGADFYLGGVITSVVDAVEGQKVVFYKVNLELTNIETNEKVWIGEKVIKKVIGKNAVKW